TDWQTFYDPFFAFIIWSKMRNTPRSKVFDDVYFSEKDGLAETRHVFLEGNHLPGRWQGRKEFTVFETGFGTGLNFLAVWDLFNETKSPGAQLHFISVEQYPLTAAEIEEYLEPWEELRLNLRILCSKYPQQMTGTHKIEIERDIFL